MNKKILALLCILMCLLTLVSCKKEEQTSADVAGSEGTVIEEKKITIVNEDSNSRPYAVMINNNHAAWPHAGLQDAYLVYEMIVEGGITRMMALYKDQETAKIGSVRSSRHYFLDYALENDAIYVHFGWSPQAQSDISKLGVDNINGLTDSKGFWRDTSLNRAYEHTAFTSIEKASEVAKSKGYKTTTDKELLLNYTADEVDLSTKENAIVANEIKIKYSDYHTTSYTYDAENKVYKRYMSGKAHTDLVTKEQYTAKNIIVYNVKNYTLNDGENKGRQGLNNIGKGTGYYITNGYAVPITWEKTSRDAQTVYKYEDGTEIDVSDGNTYIQIQPIDQETVISE